MRELGELSGFAIIGLVALLAFRYILKAYFKANSKKLDKNSAYYKNLVKLMGLNKTLHPWIGYLAVALIVVHVYIQTGFRFYFGGNQLTGMIAASALVLNVLAGWIGDKVMKKPRPAWWLWAHRSLTVAILVFILIHIL